LGSDAGKEFPFIALLHIKKPIAGASKKFASLTNLFGFLCMRKDLIDEIELATLAKQFRTTAGIRKAEVARKLGVSKTTIQQAEESPERSLTAVRCRIIELCSPFKVIGPKFSLQKKSRSQW
jgi:DNA-binding XRE family transcriptional regulator